MRRLRKVLSNVGVFVLVAALVYLAGTALLGAWPMWSAMMNDGMMGNGMMGGPGWLGALLMLLFWGGVLALIAWLLVSVFSSLFSHDRGEENPDAFPDTAEATLRERFARGEISAEEYEEALKVLRSRFVGPASGDARASGEPLYDRTGGEGHSTLDDAGPSDNGGRARRGA